LGININVNTGVRGVIALVGLGLFLLGLLGLGFGWLILVALLMTVPYSPEILEFVQSLSR
jgi:hypothetical protein